MRCATWKCFKLAVWLVVEHISRGKCEVNLYCDECLSEIYYEEEGDEDVSAYFRDRDSSGF